jgi:hypothetical protein
MTLLQLVVLNACHFEPEYHDFRSEYVIISMMILVIYGLTYNLYTHIVVRNPRPQSDRNWDNQRGLLQCEDHMCSPSVNALLRYFIKRSTLITSSFP